MLLAGLIAADRAGLLGFWPRSDVEAYHGRTFRVTRAVDGDTIVIDAPDPLHHEPQTVIRLWGVDTPETVKPNWPVEHFGPEASEFTRRLTEGRRVRIELDPSRTRGSYKRLLAYVYLPDGRMLNRLLIREGYAYADPQPRHDHKFMEQFLSLQRKAMAEGVGLWAEVTENDLPKYWKGKLELPERQPAGESE